MSIRSDDDTMVLGGVPAMRERREGGVNAYGPIYDDAQDTTVISTSTSTFIPHNTHHRLGRRGLRVLFLI
jgi:hypothetical protein